MLPRGPMQRSVRRNHAVVKLCWTATNTFKEDANEVYDPDLDVPKYCRSTGVYHTDEPFHIIFV